MVFSFLLYSIPDSMVHSYEFGDSLKILNLLGLSLCAGMEQYSVFVYRSSSLHFVLHGILCVSQTMFIQ